MLACLCVVLKFLFYFVILVFLGVIAVKIWIFPFAGVCSCRTKIRNKVALVTGGNSGIGLATAKNLAKRGARVIIACRTEKKSMEVVADIIKTTGNPNVEYRHLDFSKLSSVKKFADDFNKAFDRLDILVNNAGVAGLNQAYSEDGIERIMQINYIGPFMLTNLLMEKLKASKQSRIVIVSSYANYHHKLDVNDLAVKTPLDFYARYANSKVCNVLWTKALAKRLPQGITVNVADPGLVKTNIFQRLPRIRRFLTELIIDLFFKTAEEGAQTIIHLCVAPELEGVSGEFFSECKIKEADKIALDDEIVEKVWEETMVLLKDKL